MTKVFVGVVLALAAFGAQADPTVMGLTLGKTTENDMLLKHQATFTGKSPSTRGNTFSLQVKAMGLHDLLEVHAIFNDTGHLVGLSAAFAQEKFDWLYGAMKATYAIEWESLPPAGQKVAAFRDGGTKIVLGTRVPGKFSGVHQMQIHYARDELIDATERLEKASWQKPTAPEKPLV